MSKPAQNAVAEFHKCPKTSEEIRVRGFSFCPFCGEAINADGDHKVVVPIEPKPDIKLEPEAKPQASPESPKPAAPPVKSAEEIEKLINDRFGARPTTSVPPTSQRTPPASSAAPPPEAPKPPQPRSPLVPLLIVLAVGGLAAYAALNGQSQPVSPAEPAPAVEIPAAESPEPAPVRDMTDTGRASNPDITSAGRTLIWRPVENGLMREIRSNDTNIRALPTVKSKIVGQLKRGDIIRPSGRITDLRGVEEGEWYRVETPTTGYVRFGNTKAPSAAAKTSSTIAVHPVEPGLQVRAKISLRIRTTPSRSSNANDTGNRIQQGKIFKPDGTADDIGRDAGRQWYKVDGGFVAAWETERLAPASARPPSGSTAPTPRSLVDIGAQASTPDRAASSTTRALDALRRPRDEPAN